VWIEYARTGNHLATADKVYKHPSKSSKILIRVEHLGLIGQLIRKGKQYLLIANSYDGITYRGSAFQEINSDDPSIKNKIKLLDYYYSLVDNQHSGPVQLKLGNHLVAEGQLVNGKPHGSWKHYRERPNSMHPLKSEEHYDMGVLDGPQVKFRPLADTKLWKAKSHYEKGKITDYTSYIRFQKESHIYNKKQYQHFPNYTITTVLEVSSYTGSNRKRNLREMTLIEFEHSNWNRKETYFHGNYKFYTKDTLKLEGEYWWGAKVGLWRSYFENGELEKEITYAYPHRPKGLFTCFHENGIPKIQGMTKGKVREGKWKTFYENGKVESINQYKDGELEGKQQIFDSEGHLEMESHFENHKLNGGYSSYFSSNEKKTKGQYLNGKAVEKWTDYHENGQLKSEVEYLDGKWNGIRTIYHKNGQLFIKEEYQMNVRMNDYTEYYEDGTLRTKGQYTDGQKVGKWTHVNHDKTSEICVYSQLNDIYDTEAYFNRKGECIQKDKNGNTIPQKRQ